MGLLIKAFINLFLGPVRWFLAVFDRSTVKHGVAPVPEDQPALLLSGVELAAAIREQRMTSEEVVRAHIQRIQAVNRDINAMVQDLFDEALILARQADDLVQRTPESERESKLPAFLGVPFTVKENFGVQGLPYTAGMLRRRQEICSQDCEVVRRMRQAGAIVLGISNVSEMLMWWESNNNVYGRTNNAYNLGRVAGGSSGGEGALLGAGCSPFGLGSDVGGSIRLPAFFNGVFGHKTSANLVPRTGSYPTPAGASGFMSVFGVLSRRAADLMPVLRILAQPDGADPYVKAHVDFPDPASVDIASLTVYSLQSLDVPVVTPLDDAIKSAHQRVLDALAAAGATVKELNLPHAKHAFPIWSAFAKVWPDAMKDQDPGIPPRTFRERLTGGAPLSVVPEVIRLLIHAVLPAWLASLVCAKSPHTLPAMMLTFMEDLGGLKKDRSAALRYGNELRAQLSECLAAGDAVVVMPTFPTVTPEHRKPVSRPFDFLYCALINAIGFPATAVPTGLAKDATPTGVQVVAGDQQDHVSIAVAMYLEQHLGGWTPPPPH